MAYYANDYYELVTILYPTIVMELQSLIVCMHGALSKRTVFLLILD